MVGGKRSIVKTDSRSAITCREIPEEILVEILVRLPADSLMRFKCVSRPWSSLITSRYFTNYFFKFSSSRPRVCMNVVERGCCRLFDCYMLISSSISNLDTQRNGLVNCYNLDATTSFLQLNRLTLPGMEYFYFSFVNALRGLICFRMGNEIRIINFATRQVLSLPRMKSRMLLERGRVHEWNYFGYDPVNDEYKVLNTLSCKEANKWKSETQVLVMRTESSWRNTKSHTSPPPPLRPVQGFSVNINGVLYNGAWSHDNTYVLMSFDFNSEEFNLIEFPTEANVNSNEHLSMHNLMNYQGQVALFDYFRLKTEDILDLWVVEDAGNSKWSHKVFVLPCDQFRQSLGLDDLKIRGTGRSGEVTLSKRYGRRNEKNTYVIYDLERNCIAKEVVLETQNDRPKRLETDVWDDVESIMYLEA